jgi:SAM-dependent methyltransferase
VAYENPLAYVLGLEGLALLRSFTGEYDREFVDGRIAEIRALLGDGSAHLADRAVEVARMAPGEGYGLWSRSYDGPNTAFDVDTPVIGEILDTLPAGAALDAACGTGRISELLARRGHRVLGVDGSPDMLDLARARVPDAEFRPGDLHRLPVDDDAVDLVVCSLALTHVPDLRPVFAEFARVLRPGGHLVTSDIHPEAVLRGSFPRLRFADGAPGRIASHRHSPGDYLRAALPAGLQVRRCEEPGVVPDDPAADERPDPEQAAGQAELGPWEVWPWSLPGLVPEAARVANAGTPAEIIWHFQLA